MYLTKDECRKSVYLLKKGLVKGKIGGYYYDSVNGFCTDGYETGPGGSVWVEGIKGDNADKVAATLSNAHRESSTGLYYLKAIANNQELFFHSDYLLWNGF